MLVSITVEVENSRANPKSASLITPLLREAKRQSWMWVAGQLEI